MHERLEATVSGKVQMVMFRDFVDRKARRLKLTGEVRNQPDGTVKVIAEGSRESLDLLLEKLHHGPLLAQVEKVDVSWNEANGEYYSFSIVQAHTRA